MGRVFSFEDVRHGRVPSSAAIGCRAQWLCRVLPRIPGVIGGILCGSVLWGKHDRRSDVDCLVLYEPEFQQGVLERLRMLTIDAAHDHVDVTFFPIDSELAGTDLHNIDYMFSQHLALARDNGGLIGEDPLPYFLFHPDNARREVMSFLRAKIRKLEGGVVRYSVLDPAEQRKLLKTALEAPIHIARKIVWLYGPDLLDDSKTTVAAAYREMATEQEMKLLMQVCLLDAHYTQVLERQLTKPNHKEYHRLMTGFRHVLWDSLQFARLNALRLT